MRTLLLTISLFLCVSISIQAQEHYVYDANGKLLYTVSDSLIRDNQSVSPSIKLNLGHFVETHKTTWDHIGYQTDTYYPEQGPPYSVYTPILWGNITDIESIKLFIRYLKVVKEKYKTAEPYMHYDFYDSKLRFCISVNTNYNGNWTMYIDRDNIYKVNDKTIDAFIEACNNTINFIENPHPSSE